MIVINGTVSDSLKESLMAGETDELAHRYGNLIVAGALASEESSGQYVELGESFTVTSELLGKNIYIMIDRFDQDGYYNDNGNYPPIAVSWDDGTDAGSFGDWGSSNKITDNIFLNTNYSSYLYVGNTLTIQQPSEDFGELYFAYAE